jgi:HEPN domain-containing protein
MNLSKNDLSNYWVNRAVAHNKATLSLFRTQESRKSGLKDPCFLLAGLSIELLIKAILVKTNQKFEVADANHKLSNLLKKTKIELDEDQQVTIKFFEESILWLSKYPAPKNKKNKEFDLEQLFFQKSTKSLFRPRSANEKSWPSRKNYVKIWQKLVKIYFEIKTQNTNEFGFELNRK